MSVTAPNTKNSTYESRFWLKILFFYTLFSGSILCFIAPMSHAQVNYELASEDIRTLLTSSDKSLTVDIDFSKQLADQALKISIKKEDIPGQIYSLLLLGDIHEHDNDLKTAKKYYLDAMNLEFGLSSSHTDSTIDHNMMFYLADGIRTAREYNKALMYLNKGIASQKGRNSSAYLMHAYDLQSKIHQSLKEYEQSIVSSKHSLSIAEQLNSDKFILRSYRKIAQSYKKLSDYRTSMKFNQLAIELVKRNGDEKTVAQYLEYLSTDQRSLGMYSEALENAHKALFVQKKHNDRYRISNLLLNLSIIYLKVSSYDNSLKYALEMLAMHNDSNNLNKIASASNQLGLIYNRLGRFQEATRYYERTLSLDKSKIKPRYRASALRTMAEIKFGINDPKAAMSYAEQGLELSKGIKDLRGEASATHTIAKMLMHLNKVPDAIKQHKRSVEISLKIGDVWSESRSRIFLGLTQIETDTDIAKKEIEKGLKQAIELDAKSLQRTAYDALKDIEKRQKNYKEALQYAEKTQELRTEIDNQALENRLAEIKIAQETQSKVQEIEELRRNMKVQDLELSQRESEVEILNKENTINTLKIGEQRSRLILTLTIAIIVALLLAVVYMRYRYLKNSQNILNVHNKEIESKNASLEELNLTKDRFFSIISHDLRTPISSIIALSDMLKDNFDRFKHDEIRTTVFDIQKAAERTFLLLENLLSWAIIQLRNAHPIPKENNLKTVCQSAMSYLQSSADAKNIHIKYEISEGDIFYGDKNMIASVIRNLIANAIKYTPNEGDVCIYSKAENIKITLYIKDSGIGIDKLVLNSLFDIDRLISRRGTDGEAGTGFGLALCKDLVEKNNGNIGVTSAADQGSTFYFTLPTK